MNLAALSNIGVGVGQGADHGTQLLGRIQQLKQGQMALDAAKKQLAADAAAFTGIDPGGAGGGGGGGFSLPGAMSPPPPSAQPMQPGQPSVPSQPQQGPPAASGQPPGGMAAPQQQQAPQAAPQAPQQPGGQPVQQGGGQQMDPALDPMAGMKAVMSIAREIKSRNPGIDPQTLMLATDRVINMSKGMAPALRQQAAVVIQQMKDQTSTANTQARVGATERGQDMQQENVGTRVASNEKIAAGHDETSIRRVQQQGAQAMERTQATIAGANQRAAQGVWSREKATAYKEKAGGAVAKLKAANSRLVALTNAGVKAEDPRVAAATKDIAASTAELDRINTAAKVEAPASGGGQLPSDLPDPKGHAEGSAAKDANGKTVAVIKNGQWAPPAGP